MSNSNSNKMRSRHIALYVHERSEEAIMLEMQAFENNFSAQGSAFFKISEIEQFLMSIRKFPLVESPDLSISGGYFDDSGDVIINEHLHISFTRFNSSGLISMEVRLFQPHPEHWRKGFGTGGRCSYFLNHRELSEFSDDLERLVVGTSSYFEFENFDEA